MFSAKILIYIGFVCCQLDSLNTVFTNFMTVLQILATVHQKYHQKIVTVSIDGFRQHQQETMRLASTKLNVAKSKNHSVLTHITDY